MTKIKRNPQPMDKAAEKRLYREFILATPEHSYLRTVLTDSRDYVFGNIDNDIAWPVYERSRHLDRDIENSKTELARLKREILAAREELAEVRRDVKYAEQDFASTVDKARHFVDAMEESRLSISRAVREHDKRSSGKA